ncbi:hypothetical protein [Campylobacter geochelonis]|uniref:hypothetical protein n=1 Tax=Campylobacter geochelonis TaxID=1780362 RepID=UPI000770761D|nr:hypothetical protein [Campylobacter geochelonis]CZE51447.1 KWG [Campylobacter geochelonis]
MKKTLIFSLFSLIFASLVFYLFLERKNIDTDIYSLANTNYEKGEKEAIDALLKRFSSEVILLSNNQAKFQTAIDEFKKSELFSDVFYEINSLSLDELNKLKLATLEHKTALEILQNKEQFFKQSSREIFNKFSIKPLPTSLDFFSLSKHSSLLAQAQNIKFDYQKHRFIASFDGEIWYFAKAELRQNYDNSKLINLYQNLQSKSVLISSGAIYAAFGKQSGQSESLYMSIIALVLCGVVVWVGFRNWRVFYVVLVVVFGLTTGLAATFAVFGKVHILSIVVSSSLIGLMLDFCIHWLSKNLNQKVDVTSIKSMRKIFLLGLFITASGYFVFLFASSVLLKQIAIFSLFALLGAFVFTYFVMPLILANHEFKALKFVDVVLETYAKFLTKFSSLNLGFICVIFAVLFGLILCFGNFKDNIKEYSSSDEKLVQTSIKVAKILGESSSYKFALIRGEGVLSKEQNLTNYLKIDGLIDDYSGLSKILLDEPLQTKLKNEFKKSVSDNAVLEIYTKLGFDKTSVQNELLKVSNLATISPKEAVKSEILSSLSHFYIDENKTLIFLNNVKNEAKIDEILHANGSLYIDFANSLNQAFSKLKIEAIWLKILAFLLAFAVLWKFFGLRRSFEMMVFVLISTILSLFLLVLFGFGINIFVIFGVILAGAVGIDYMIFASNLALSVKERIFGINLAALTSAISFLMLFFSKTAAVSVFGLSVGLNILFCAFFASILTLRQKS